MLQLAEEKIPWRERLFQLQISEWITILEGLARSSVQLLQRVGVCCWNGKKTRFWLDVWTGGCPLKITFPNLFEICNQQEWSVFRALQNGEICLTFRRNFDTHEELEWEALCSLINNTSLSSVTTDTVRWDLEKTGNFTTSLYSELTFAGFSNKWMLAIWRAKLPLKIKFFLWQVCNDKLQSAEQLRKRNQPGPIECKLCGQIESTDHIFFQCVVAQYCWCVLRDTLEWESAPTSVNEMHEKMIGDFNLPIRDFIFLFGSLAWSLWLIRNDLVFHSIVPLSPNVHLFRLISFMQNWKILNKEKGQLWIDSVTLKAKTSTLIVAI